MTRDQIHGEFVRLFDRSTEVRSVSIEEVLQAEAELAVTFPDCYLTFITTYGAVYTPSILDLVTGGESEIAPEGASWDISHFLKGSELVETSRQNWSAGMDNYLVPIAYDSMGNLFVFRRQVYHPRPADSSVLFFDHDFCEVNEERDSFDGWLSSFISLHAKVAGSGSATD